MTRYYSKVSLWENSKRDEFSGLKVTINDTTEGSLIQQDQDSLMITEDFYTSIRPYSALYYSISLSNSKKFTKTDLVSIELVLTEGEKTSIIQVPALKVYKTTEVSLLRGGCKSIEGTYEGFADCKINWVIFT